MLIFKGNFVTYCRVDGICCRVNGICCRVNGFFVTTVATKNPGFGPGSWGCCQVNGVS